MNMSDSTIIIKQDEDGVFVARCLELPGCVSQGMSWAEAQANLHEARQGYLECLSRYDEAVPRACRLDQEGGGQDS